MAEPPQKGYQECTVSRRRDINDELAVFWIETKPFVDFEAGQYVTLAADGVSGGFVKRPYSVLSAPEEPAYELFIELVEGGELTPPLWDLGEGDSLWIRNRVAGRFLFDTEHTRHLMACTVTGIAPFLSMIRSRLQGDPRLRGGRLADDDHEFLIIFGASHPEDYGPYLEEVRNLPEGDFHVVPTISRPWQHPDWDGETGRVEEVLRKHLDRLEWVPDDVAVYACGNPDMIENVRGVAKRAGIEAFHEEKYFTTPIGEEESDAVEKAPASPKAPPGGIKLKRVKPKPAPPGGITLKKVKPEEG